MLSMQICHCAQVENTGSLEELILSTLWVSGTKCRWPGLATGTFMCLSFSLPPFHDSELPSVITRILQSKPGHTFSGTSEYIHVCRIETKIVQNSPCPSSMEHILIF